jgi:hypothetical protein
MDVLALAVMSPGLPEDRQQERGETISATALGTTQRTRRRCEF